MICSALEVPTLSEYESKQFLAGAGIQTPPERLVHSPDEAVAAARELGFPIALKLCGAGIAHKTERDGVRLDLGDAATVSGQATGLLERLRPEDGSAGLLVQRMVGGRRELIAGLVRDPAFGPCVMFGIGGILAEVLGDVAFAVAPLDERDASQLVDALEHQNLLGAFRGEPAADRAKLAALLQALGQIGLERPEVRSIDLNPLILEGPDPVVVDALVEIETDPGDGR